MNKNDLKIERGQSFTVSRSTRLSNFGILFAAILVFALAMGPLWLGRADMRLLGEIFYFLALAQMWNLLAGYGGLVSVGQQAFIGIGGYLLFILTINFGVGAVLSIPLAGLIGAIVSLPVAFLVFRLRGHYFAIGTWVVAEPGDLGAQIDPGKGKLIYTKLPGGLVKGIYEAPLGGLVLSGNPENRVVMVVCLSDKGLVGFKE